MGKHASSPPVKILTSPTSTAAQETALSPVSQRFEHWIRVLAVMVKITVGVLGLITLLATVPGLSLDTPGSLFPIQQTASEFTINSSELGA